MRRELMGILLAVSCIAGAVDAIAGTDPQGSPVEATGGSKLATASATTTGVRPADARANAMSPDSRNQNSTIPDVEMITHENRSVRFYADMVKGKVVIINFMFTSCDGFCPLTTANLVRVQAALGDRVGRDVFLYSITLDPDHDTPEVLQQYRQEIGAKPGWIFLTGKLETIERLRRKLGVYDLDPVIDADKTKHSGVVVYGNDAKDRWAAMPGLAKPEFIAKTVLRVAPPENGRRD
jgi:protein SCO1